MMLIANLQNLQQQNCMLLMIKITQTIVKEMKIVQVKFEAKITKSNLCDYSDAYILVTGNITATSDGANDRVVFKNFAPFTKCITHINDKDVDNADNACIQFD